MLAIAIIFIITFILYFFSAFFFNSSEVKNFEYETKLLNSNVSLKLESLINKYIDESIKMGFNIGPVNYFNLRYSESFFSDSSRDISILFEHSELKNELKVAVRNNNFLYELNFDLNMLFKELEEDLNIINDFVFIDNNGNFIYGNLELYNLLKNSKLSFEKTVDRFKKGMIFNSRFREYGIYFFYYKENEVNQYLRSNYYFFIGIIIISVFTSSVLLFFYSYYLKNQISKPIISIIKQIVVKEKLEYKSSQIEDFEYFFKDLRKTIERKLEEQDIVINVYKNTEKFYENMSEMNLILLKIIEKIKISIDDQNDQKSFFKIKEDLKIKILESGLDNEIYVSLLNDLEEIIEKINLAKNKCNETKKD
jgi:hypothetical protein